jgi:phosphoglycerol transferase MdoB-like AlkP superfamily enzyme
VFDLCWSDVLGWLDLAVLAGIGFISSLIWLQIFDRADPSHRGKNIHLFLLSTEGYLSLNNIFGCKKQPAMLERATDLNEDT